MFHVEGIELCLGLLQGNMCLTGLEHFLGVIRTDAQGLTTIHDILAQSQRQGSNTLLGLFIADGIEVQRAEHTAHVGIIVVAILFAHHLLQDDRHLLLVDDIAGGRHIGFGVAVEHRSIDTLDGSGKHLQHLVFVVDVGNHISGIDTGKGLVMGVFEQT